VSYVNYGTWQGGGGFTAQLEITNSGPIAINGWTAKFAFTGDQRLREGWSGRFSQAGATMTVLPESFNRIIQPDATVYVGFNATMSGSYANPNPGLVTVNGSACAPR
jgi:endoglucanase